MNVPKLVESCITRNDIKTYTWECREFLFKVTYKLSGNYTYAKAREEAYARFNGLLKRLGGA